MFPLDDRLISLALLGTAAALAFGAFGRSREAVVVRRLVVFLFLTSLSGFLAAVPFLLVDFVLALPFWFDPAARPQLFSPYAYAVGAVASGVFLAVRSVRGNRRH